MADKIIRAIIGSVIAIACLLSYACAMVLYDDTLIVWWKPVVVCAILGALSGIPFKGLWKRLTQSSAVIVNYLCQVVFATGLLLAGFYTLNYTLADSSTSKEEKVTVVKKYREEHHRSRRVGTRRYVQGEPYHTYHIDIEFADGRTKSMSLPLDRYNRVRKGDSASLDVREGWLGFPVIRHRDIRLPAHKKPVPRYGRRPRAHKQT